MQRNLLFLLIFLPFHPFQAFSQCDSLAIYANDSTNAVCMEVGPKVRTIHTNDLPNHPYGSWPSGNPVSGQDLTFYMCAFPEKAPQSISLYDAGNFNGCSPYIEFGVGVNGIRMAPFGARWFVNPNTQEENTDWNVEALVMFSMDFNNSHSNGGGEYHYHGIPTVYFTDSLNIDGTQHSPVVGYAADGFPIYYKYVYDDPMNPNGGVRGFSSGHSLKPGNRPGDGITAPDGPYDGLYVEDYEYLNPNWELDDCNGRTGITPEYPNGTYYYVMTDNWPYIPRCFYGTVLDNTFRIGPNCPASTAAADCSEDVANSLSQFEAANVVIAPNPSSSILQISETDPSLESKVTQVSIYDLKGKIWYVSNEFKETIDIADLPGGSYFLQINFEQSQVTKKIIIQK